MTQNRAWTAEEDAVVLRYLPLQAHRQLKGRTLYAVELRRWKLRHNLLKSNGGGWTRAEDDLIKKNYPHCQKTKDILHLFPGRNALDVNTRASHLGVPRIFAGNDEAWIKGHHELLDQIRVRAKSDGISFRRLDDLTGTLNPRTGRAPRYFQVHGMAGHKGHKGIHLRRIVKAIEFFGGKLVIDWCDR